MHIIFNQEYYNILEYDSTLLYNYHTVRIFAQNFHRCALRLTSSFVSSREESRAMDKGGKKRKGTTKRRRVTKWWVDAADGSIVFSNLGGNPSTTGNSRVPLQPPRLYLNSSAYSSDANRAIERARRASTESGFCAASRSTVMACQACQRISQWL